MRFENPAREVLKADGWLGRQRDKCGLDLVPNARVALEERVERCALAPSRGSPSRRLVDPGVGVVLSDRAGARRGRQSPHEA